MAPLTRCLRASTRAFAFPKIRLRERKILFIFEKQDSRHVNGSAEGAQGFGVRLKDFSLRRTEADFCLS